MSNPLMSPPIRPSAIPPNALHPVQSPCPHDAPDTTPLPPRHRVRKTDARGGRMCQPIVFGSLLIVSPSRAGRRWRVPTGGRQPAHRREEGTCRVPCLRSLSQTSSDYSVVISFDPCICLLRAYMLILACIVVSAPIRDRQGNRNAIPSPRRVYGLFRAIPRAFLPAIVSSDLRRIVPKDPSESLPVVLNSAIFWQEGREVGDCEAVSTEDVSEPRLVDDLYSSSSRWDVPGMEPQVQTLADVAVQ
jgi:hypothetical protein